jgi:hypothetical protein
VASSVQNAIKYIRGAEFQNTPLAQVLKVIGESSRIQQRQLEHLRPAIAPALSSLDREQLKIIADFGKYFTAAAHQNEGFLYDVHHLASQIADSYVQAAPTAFSRKLAASITEVVEAGKENLAAVDSVEQLVQDKIATLPKDSYALKELALIVAVISMLINLSTFYFNYRRQEDSRASSNLQNIIVIEEQAQTAYLERIAESIERLIADFQHLPPTERRSTYYFVERPVDIKVKPIMESKTVATLAVGQSVKLIQRNHTWMKVGYFDHTEAVSRNGWVLKKYLRLDKN